MFERAVGFNGDMSRWRVDRVTNMERMFEGTVSFNDDLSGWKVGNTTDISHISCVPVAFISK